MAIQPGRNRLADIVGPFYTAADVAKWLSVQESEVAKRVRQRRLLGCTTADEQLLLPVAQFKETGSAHSGLLEVLNILATGTDDPWTWALWLSSCVPDQLGGMSAFEWLKKEEDLDPLLVLASRDADSWSS